MGNKESKELSFSEKICLVKKEFPNEILYYVNKDINRQKEDLSKNTILIEHKGYTFGSVQFNEKSYKIIYFKDSEILKTESWIVLKDCDVCKIE